MRHNSHKSQQSINLGGSMETFKWLMVFLILAIGVVGNYHFNEIALPIRAVSLIALFLVAGGLFLLTNKGKSFKNFALEAKNEVRKVVWPSRQETMQTTLMVLAVVFVVGLILWGVDLMLLKIVAMLTGYGA